MKGDSEVSRPDSDDANSDTTDVVVVHGVTEDGEGLQVVRQRDDRLESGVLQRVKSGQPIQGELVSLKPRPSSPLVCDVKVVMAATQPELTDVAAPRTTDRTRGPARVASDRYRDNWDAIWSRGQDGGLPN